MKHLYVALALLFSLTSFSQNGLLGEWFLHYIEVDGVQQYSTIPNSLNDISFNEDTTFNGTVCNNGYSGNYEILDSNTLNIPEVVVLGGYCNYLTESQLFLNPYLWTVLSDADGISDIFTYSISGANDEETLILTNSENNSAVYGRTALPENKLPGVWYLHSITKSGVEEINTFRPTFDMNFTLDPGSFSSIVYDGTAICNDYFGEYHLEGIDKIRLLGFGFTLSICNQNGASLEESYFSFFSEAQTGTMLLTYAISGSDDNEFMTLNDQNGDFVTYGRQTLSVSENEHHQLSFRLKENPVKNELFLESNEALRTNLNYQIYSIDGKLVLRNKLLNTNSIDVNKLNSGLYFLVISSENNFKQTFKFAKQ